MTLWKEIKVHLVSFVMLYSHEDVNKHCNYLGKLIDEMLTLSTVIKYGLLSLLPDLAPFLFAFTIL